MDKYNIEKLIYIHHWNNLLFSLICSRNKNFKFLNGQFILLGVIFNNQPLTRAYSIVSSNYDDYLEFLSIKIINGSLTSKLKYLKINDNLLISKKPSGTLLINNLLPGKILWLISTGTGIAPFISVIKDFNIYNTYKLIILTHTVRYEDALTYRYYIYNDIFNNEIFKNFKNQFIYYPTLTKYNFSIIGRITDNVKTGKIFRDLKLNKFSKEIDRIMICGSNKMIKDFIEIIKDFGLIESKSNKLGHYVIERAFVD